MASSSFMANERLLDIALSPFTSPEPELQRGRKRRRDLLDIRSTRNHLPSGESATLRGRCRHRSSSRFLDVSSLSRPTSQRRPPRASQRQSSHSPSPSRRKVLHIMELASPRRRSQSPSRSRSPYTVYMGILHDINTTKRRRQRTRSRSRRHSVTNLGFAASDSGFVTEMSATKFSEHCEIKEQSDFAAGDSHEHD